jgi:hypothetical protein
MLLEEGTTAGVVAAAAGTGSTAVSSLEERFLQACKVGDIETVRKETNVKAYPNLSLFFLKVVI